MARRRRRKQGDPRVAIAYVRVSREGQDLSPEAQRSSIETWCARQSAQLVACFADEGVSGGCPIDERAGLLGALDALEMYGAGVLVVARRDRVARDIVLAAMVERLAERAGAQLVSADGVGNGAGPEAALMRNIVSAFAAYERELIRARTKAALAAKKAQGRRVGSIPFGHKLAADGLTLVPMRLSSASWPSCRSEGRRVHLPGHRPASDRRRTQATQWAHVAPADGGQHRPGGSMTDELRERRVAALDQKLASAVETVDPERLEAYGRRLMSQDERVTLRLSTDLLERVDRVVERLELGDELAAAAGATLDRSKVLRIAVYRGLASLEREAGIKPKR